MGALLSIAKWFLGPVGRYVLGAIVLVTVVYSVYHHVDSVGYARGVADIEKQYQKNFTEHLRRAQAEAIQIAREDAEITEYYEKWRVTYRTKIQTTPQEVANAVQIECTKCGLNPGGLRLLNELRSLRPGDGKTPDTPATSEREVPPAAAAPDGGMPRTGRIIDPRQPHVQRLRGSPGRAATSCQAT